MAVYDWHNNRFEPPLTFSSNENGIGQFSLLLKQESTDPVYLLVDLVEEEFREDTMPHVMGGDRRALIQTKLGRLFRDSTYSHAMFQGRESDGRRDDRMLFTALLRPDLLAPWVSTIVRHRVPLAGIYSLPIISESLAKTLAIDSSHALIVTMQSSDGLRQTFLKEQKLKLSRLAIVPPGARQSQASYVLGEIEQIRRYLNSLRLLPHDSPLDVYLLGDASLLEEVQRQSPDSLTTRHHLVDLKEVAEKIGLKGRYESPFGDRLFCHVLAKKPSANHYASANQTRYYTLHQARFGLRVASAALLVGSVLWSGVKLLDGVTTARDSATLEDQTAFYNERYRIARERLPETPADSRDVQQAVELADKLQIYKSTPLDMMMLLSLGISDFPEIQLDSIRWKSSSDPQADVASVETVGRITSFVRRGRAPEKTSVLYQLAEIQGHIEPFSGDYRAALEMVRRLAERLKSEPDVEEVKVLAAPLEIGSGQRLSGVVDAKIGTAPFELRVVLKDKDGEAS